MRIVCPKCNTGYELEENAVDLKSFMARCSKCNTIFNAFKPISVEDIKFINLSAAKNTNRTKKIIVISNQKGGVAKTSTCLNLGYSLSLLGKRILLIDFDSQANLTLSLGFKDEKSFYDIINGNQKEIKNRIIETKYPNLWLLPSNKNMVILTKRYFGAKDFEFLLIDRLLGIIDMYDYILIDTPPSIEFFTLNALTAASLVIIPSQCDLLSTHGIEQLIRIIDLIKSKSNPTIKVKILVTMYEKESTMAKMIKSKLNRLYPEILFGTVIETDNKIRESQLMNTPVLKYYEISHAGLQYNSLCKEIAEIF